MPRYTVTYFDGRGYAEKSRMLLALAGQEFTDERMQDPEFDVKRDQGLFTVGLDRVPMLTVVDESGEVFQLAQSKSIERYLAKTLGFYGCSLECEAKIDMTCEHIRDISQKYSDSSKGKSDAELAAVRTNFIANEAPIWLAKLEKTLLANTDAARDVAVGAKMSLADVAIFHLCRDYFDDKAALASMLSQFPKLVAICDNVENGLKDYLAKRPASEW